MTSDTTTLLRDDDTLELRKARGAYFTPLPIVRFLTRWAVTDDARAVLEPSCGEAAFLLGAAEAAAEHGTPVELVGVELHESSAQFARDALGGRGVRAEVVAGDFFDAAPSPRFDAVIGNPPYIRYQSHVGASRANARRAAAEAGVELSELASSWAAFVVHSTSFLAEGGRLGLVLPAELLSTNYAGPVRAFLLQNFAEVQLVLFGERVFPGVQEEVVLLQAAGWRQGPTDRFHLFQAENSADLADMDSPSTWVPTVAGEKWTPAIVAPLAAEILNQVGARPEFAQLERWGRTSLGAVTGANRFFTMTKEEVRELNLRSTEVVRISPPGSSHLRQLVFSEARHRAMAAAGEPVYLFRPGDDPSPGARVKIAQGEIAGVDQAYKCRIRAPWWRTPLVEVPDLFLTYMNAGVPQLAANSARVRHLNSVHGVYLAPPMRQLGCDVLPMAALNTVTQLSAETVGRAYGGGMLKIEPREAARWLVPSFETLTNAHHGLRAIKPRVKDRLASGDLAAATALVDQVLLVDGLGMGAADMETLTTARAALRARRAARGREAGR